MSTLDQALIGNCGYAALISRQAEVTWACLPRFDGDPVFCSLLGSPQAGSGYGRFAIELERLARSEQEYVRNTAITVTRLYDADGGAVEVTDFAPRFEQFGRTFRPMMLIRRVRRLAGSPLIKIVVRPVFDYGKTRPSITQGSNHVRFVGPDGVLRLTTDASITAIADETSFILEDELTLVLGPDETLPHSPGETGAQFYEHTCTYWQEWVRSLAIPFEWQEAVIRAAITLKLNTFEDTGAVIAAATTSIPEAPESGRNWDYRYCWLRDAYFVINALNRLGATKTMENYVRYIINLVATNSENGLRPVYRINGRADLHETIADSLPGYRNMGPVRVGNQAYEQRQNDVYGSAILATAHLFFDERLRRRGDESVFRRLEELGEQAVAVYLDPDAGPWEFRGFEKVHTFSTAICWAAARVLGAIADKLGFGERAQYWRSRAEEIAEAIKEQAWNEQRQSYVASFGGDDVDASLMLLYEWGFLEAGDPRLASTVKAVEEELRTGDFLYRYVHEDDFGRPHTAFMTCAFWYVDALAAVGREDEARRMFERLLESRNHVGLLSEDIDPLTGELWGNFPQTYSMVGLINSAMRLSKSWEEGL
ncbi:glucoamylase [Halorhodospira halochloris]|uniref:Glucoamylase n=1 Tax=Halorhodospira halochloris TaxID=1052 RepID=A0A120MZF9_HALHR|nr:glycoside hydrolase family 15 protein [Halorhodospira halochloris]MBK1650762.1 glucoamylase [Halorhodospira halochloris]BAU56743.1 glucoamylase [Halorhodospira halochloris]